MARFLMVYFLVYGGAHGYIYWVTTRAFPRLGKWRWAVAAFLVLMVLGPIFVRMFARAGLPVRWFGLLAFVWMGVAMWICCAAAVLDAWNVGCLLASFKWETARSAIIHGRAMALVILAWLAFACVWSPLEARNIRLERFTIKTDKLPAGSDPIRLVLVSDMHIGSYNTQGATDRMLARIREAKPDILVSTGDLIDGRTGLLDGILDEIAAVPTPLGKFAVLGNHEYYHGLRESLDCHEVAGFILLRETAAMAGPIRIVGVDDPAGTQRMNSRSRMNEDAVLPPANDPVFTVLLKHRPVVRKGSEGRCDLQLSGHTHGGQIFPFGIINLAFYPMGYGMKQLSSGGRLYISRGTGTWGPPMRLFAPPEVTLFVIEPARP